MGRAAIAAGPTSKAVAKTVVGLMHGSEMTVKDVSVGTGLSYGYLTMRLKQERPFTVDDVTTLASYFGLGLSVFLEMALGARDLEQVAEDDPDSPMATVHQLRASDLPPDDTLVTEAARDTTE